MNTSVSLQLRLHQHGLFGVSMQSIKLLLTQNLARPYGAALMKGIG